MFGKLFLGETKKLVRPKALITIAVICVVFFILFAVVYNINLDAMVRDLEIMIEGIENDSPVEEEKTEEEIAEEYGYRNVDFVKIANPDNVDAILADLRLARDEAAFLNKQKGTKGSYGGEIYYYDCAITLLEYMKANDIYGDINVEGYRVYYSMRTAESFALSYFEFVVAILSIYGIVMAAGLYADEYSKGTIKLVMLRPVGRNMLTTAKLLALFSHLVVLLGLTTLAAYVYGAIAFGSVATEKVFVVFNSQSVFASTSGAVVLYKMFFKTVGMLSFVSLAFAIGTISRKKTLGIVITLIIYLGIVSAIFSAFGGERFVFSTNTDFSSYFGMTTAVMDGANFYIALPVYLAYIAAIFASLYLTVKKRDII